MYTGRMIEELIGSVQRAEGHAAPGLATSEQAAPAWFEPRAYQFNQTSVIEELLGVA